MTPTHDILPAGVAAALRDLLSQIRFAHCGPAHSHWLRRRDAALRSRQRRSAFGQALLPHLAQDHAAAPALLELVSALLRLTPFSGALQRGILQLLDQLAELPPARRSALIRLFAEHHAQIWSADSLRPWPRRDLAGWLAHIHARRVRPICELLAATADAGLVAELLACGALSSAWHLGLRDPARLRWLLDRQAIFGASKSSAASRLARLAARQRHTADLRANVDPLLAALGRVAPERRAVIFVGLIDGLRLSRRSLRHLPLLAGCLPAVLRLPHAQLCYAELLARWLDPLAASDPARAVRRISLTLTVLLAAPPAARPSAYLLGQMALLADALAPADDGQFQRLLGALGRAAPPLRDDLRGAVALLRRLPALAGAIAHLVPEQPRRCAALTNLLGALSRLGPLLRQRLALLDPGPARPAAAPALSSADLGWRQLLALAPLAAAPAASYLHARWVCGLSAELPPGVRRALEAPARLARERDHLERLAADQPQRAGLAARRDALARRLADPTRLLRLVAAEARERMARAAAEAQLAAAEAVLDEICRDRLIQLAGSAPPAPLSPLLRDAVLLGLSIDSNRPQLRQLLRAHVRGEAGWRERAPGNAAFLAKLAASGADVAAWLGDHSASAGCPALSGGQARIWLERDPLHVLQMGAYFKTCLAPDGSNAFSVVANACDLNKRVLYVRDGAGRVVARKLLAISADGHLLGYRLYTTLNAAAEAQLAPLVDAFLRRFAAACRITLADDGEVTTLIAQSWYDDGPQPWATTEQPCTPPGSSPSASGSATTCATAPTPSA